MSKQPTRRRRATGAAARTVVVGVAVAALVGIVGPGQARAGTDERVLERQGRIDRQKAAAGWADEQGKAAESSQGSPTENVRRFIRPEPRMYSEPQFGGDEQVAPAPAPSSPAGGRGGLVISLVVAALLLGLGAATTWRLRHRRPRPDPTT
jgi:uncharacterized protein HemX